MGSSSVGITGTFLVRELSFCAEWHSAAALGRNFLLLLDYC